MNDTPDQKHHVASLLQRLEQAPDWKTPDLPADLLQRLREFATKVNAPAQDSATSVDGATNADRVVCFAGPNSPEKMKAAQFLAHELGSDLFRVNTNNVVSHYIGETEKNLTSIFTGGRDSGAILLFDEGDALFGKRSEVKDSHDRYANVEPAQLINLAGARQGLTIFACETPIADSDQFGLVVNFPVT